MISKTNLTVIPYYIRFNIVDINYCSRLTTIRDKSESIKAILAPIKFALNGSKFEFKTILEIRFNYFTDLIEHIGNELLTICNNCRSYRFTIYYLPACQSMATNAIATILQFEQIALCSHVFFDLRINEITRTALECDCKLPVDAIANWLNRRHQNLFDVLKLDWHGQVQKRRNLTIEINDNIRNFSRILNYLKEVTNHS